MKTAKCLVCGFEAQFTETDKGFESDMPAQLQKCVVFLEQVALGVKPQTECPHFMEAIQNTP